MKRSKELVKLTHEHHRALVLARRAKMNGVESEKFKKLMEDFPAQWEKEIAPHFAEEERTILRRLREEGEGGLADRLEKDHSQLRALAVKISCGEREALKRFGETIYKHVRWEERELFPFYERLIGLE